MKTTLLFIFALACMISSTIAEDTLPQNQTLQPLYKQLGDLFHHYYPNATGHLLGDKIHFEYDTRIFIVHEPSKMGEWQDPWEERGPKTDGILCEIELQHGTYGGAAVVPQTFDKRYFTVLLLAPYFQKIDAYLYVHLSYPREASKEFLKAFQDAIDHFSH